MELDLLSLETQNANDPNDIRLLLPCLLSLIDAKSFSWPVHYDSPPSNLKEDRKHWLNTGNTWKHSRYLRDSRFFTEAGAPCIWANAFIQKPCESSWLQVGCFMISNEAATNGCRLHPHHIELPVAALLHFQC